MVPIWSDFTEHMPSSPNVSTFLTWSIASSCTCQLDKAASGSTHDVLSSHPIPSDERIHSRPLAHQQTSFSQWSRSGQKICKERPERNAVNSSGGLEGLWCLSPMAPNSLGLGPWQAVLPFCKPIILRLCSVPHGDGQNSPVRKRTNVVCSLLYISLW